MAPNPRMTKLTDGLRRQREAQRAEDERRRVSMIFSVIAFLCAMVLVAMLLLGVV